MNRRQTLSRIILLATSAMFGLGGAGPVAAADAPAVKLTEGDGKVTVEIGGKPFTEYRFAPEPGLPYARPYFYPVRAADGVEVTSDQARFNPKEHPHHRSLWVAQGLVNGVDHWTHGKTDAPPQQRHVKFEKVAGDTIVEQLAWEGATKDAPVLLNETRTWRFMAYPDGSRGIDLTSVYDAPTKPVTFGDTKEAGLCSVRLVKAIADSAVITQSTGARSEKEPNKAKKDPGDEGLVWGKKAAWCDLSGKIAGKDYGAAVFDHPGNPGAPANWHVRRYGLLAANPFGLHDYEPKTVVKGAGDLKIEPGKPVTFKYRVVIHAGDAAAADLKAKYAAYVDGK